MVLGPGKILVGGLAMERQRIVHGSRNAARLQSRCHAIPILELDRVLCPNRPHMRGYLRHRDEIGQGCAITLSYALPPDDFIVEDRKLLQQNRGLKRVYAPVDANTHIIVFVAALAVYAERPHCRGQRVIVGQDRAAIAVAAKGLGWKKARPGRVPETAESASAIGCPEALRGILKHEKAILLGD